MKIAIMAPLVTAIREPQRGGSQAFVSDLARGLTGRGHDVHVYAASGSQIPGVTVIDTGVDPDALASTLYRAAEADSAREALSAAAPATCATAAGAVGAAHAAGAAEAAFARAYACVRRIRYDVVHNHAFDAPAVRLAATLAAPTLHTMHLPPDKLVAAALHAAVSRDKPPAIATVSAFQAAAWRQIVPIDAILPPCIPTRAIPWSDKPGNGAVFAGRLSPEKGAAQAIDIAAKLGVPLDIFGDTYDSEYVSAELSPRIAQPGVTAHRAVPRATLWEAMARAAVVLYPAMWDEPFGMAAAEAQACGTPVVGFRRGGLSEVVVDGLTGFLVQPGDLQAFADSVARTAEISRTACRAHAEQSLDLDLTLDAHERVYERMMSAYAHDTADG
jgi:glycosyltransferase involved in cell wall biosynthesis